jgi:hypothetical protein
MFFQLLVLGCGSISPEPLLGKYLKDLEDSHNGILPTARNYSTIAQLSHQLLLCSQVASKSHMALSHISQNLICTGPA